MICPQELVKEKLRTKFKNAKFKVPQTNWDLSSERENKRIRLATSRASNIGLPNYGPPEYDAVPEARMAGYQLAADGDLAAEEVARLKRASFPDRRWMLVAERRSIDDFKKRYGWLFDSDEVRMSYHMYDFSGQLYG